MNGSGTRSSLMYETVRIVDKLKPKYVIWENVKNLLSKKHRHNFDNYLERMESMGYRNYYQVLNAKDYGIPQNRERVFTISIRADIEKEFHFPEKEELKLRLKDMLEEQVDEKYYLSDKIIKFYKRNEEEQKAKGNGFTFGVSDGNKVARAITTRAGSRMDDNFIKIKNATKQGYDSGVVVKNKQYTDYSKKKILNNIVKGDIAGTITANAMQSFNHDNCHLIKNELRIRKLTPKECWRLMRFQR